MINNNYDDVIREIYLMKIGSSSEGYFNMWQRERERKKEERQ